MPSTIEGATIRIDEDERAGLLPRSPLNADDADDASQPTDELQAGDFSSSSEVESYIRNLDGEFADGASASQEDDDGGGFADPAGGSAAGAPADDGVAADGSAAAADAPEDAAGSPAAADTRPPVRDILHAISAEHPTAQQAAGDGVLPAAQLAVRRPPSPARGDGSDSVDESIHLDGLGNAPPEFRNLVRAAPVEALRAPVVAETKPPSILKSIKGTKFEPLMPLIESQPVELHKTIVAKAKATLALADNIKQREASLQRFDVADPTTGRFIARSVCKNCPARPSDEVNEDHRIRDVMDRAQECFHAYQVEMTGHIRDLSVT